MNRSLPCIEIPKINLRQDIDDQLELVACEVYCCIKKVVLYKTLQKYLTHLILKFQFAWKHCLLQIQKSQPLKSKSRRSKALHATIQNCLWYIDTIKIEKYNGWKNPQATLELIETSSKVKLMSLLYQRKWDLFEMPVNVEQQLTFIDDIELYNCLIINNYLSPARLRLSMHSKEAQGKLVGEIAQCMGLNSDLLSKLAKSPKVNQLLLCKARSGKKQILHQLNMRRQLNSTSEPIHSLVYLDIAYANKKPEVAAKINQYNLSRGIKTLVLNSNEDRIAERWYYINKRLTNLNNHPLELPHNFPCLGVKQGLYWFYTL